MFESTGAVDNALVLRASFWQCFKAGVAFTLGAMVVIFIASIASYVVWLSLIVSILSRR